MMNQYKHVCNESRLGMVTLSIRGIALLSIICVFGLLHCSSGGAKHAPVTQPRVVQSDRVTTENNEKGRLLEITSQAPKYDCERKIDYISEYSNEGLEIEWSIEKKKIIIEEAIKAVAEIREDWPNQNYNVDNGKIPINITIGTEDAPMKGFLFHDGEIEMEITLPESRKNARTTVKTWTGSKQGVEQRLSEGEAVCLRNFYLSSWGTVGKKEIVVLVLNMNIGGGCYQFSNGKWGFYSWSTMGDEPLYNIIIWNEKNSWNSKVVQTSIYRMEKKEICEAILSIE